MHSHSPQVVCLTEGKRSRCGEYKCMSKTCDGKFIMKHMAEAHQHNSDGQLFYSCPKCPNYETTKLHTFKSHWESKHKIQRICNQCDKTFASSRSLWYHKKAVHISKEEKCSCEICGKIFNS